MQIQSKELLAALKKIGSVFGGLTVMPILSSFKVDGDTITGSNLECTITTKLSVKNTDKPFVLPYNEIVKICSNTSGLLTITPEKITFGKKAFWSNGKPEDVSLFPLNETLKNSTMVSVSTDFCNSVIKAARCTFAEKLAVQGNVSLRLNEKTLNVCATAMDILYYEPFDVQLSHGETFDILLPTSLIRCIVPDDYNMYVDGHKIMFKNDNTTLSGSLIDSDKSFPDYTGIVNLKSKYPVNFDRKELIDAVSMVAIYDAEFPCEFKFSKLGVELQVVDKLLNKVGGASLSCINNVDFGSVFFIPEKLLLLVGLLPAEIETVNIGLTGQYSGALITADDTNIKLFIMPIRNDK